MGLWQDIEGFIWKFWWGQCGDRRKIHWNKWNVLCQPKTKGGLGFKDLWKFNKAMLAKQVWRFIQDIDSLFYKVFRAKYFPNCSIFEAASSSNSFAWKNILRSRNLIARGSRWRVGDGKTIWLFKMLGYWTLLMVRLHLPQVTLALEIIVDTISNPYTSWWNTHLIDLCFYPPEAQYIKSLPLCSTPQPNILIWPKEKSGHYSMKLGYKALTELSLSDLVRTEQLEAQKTFWRSIWKLKVPGKIKHFVEVLHKFFAHKRKFAETYNPSRICLPNLW